MDVHAVGVVIEPAGASSCGSGCGGGRACGRKPVADAADGGVVVGGVEGWWCVCATGPDISVGAVVADGVIEHSVFFEDSFLEVLDA